jgi:Cu+-exporting ATPase
MDSVVTERRNGRRARTVMPDVPCYHCGTAFTGEGIVYEDKSFCCEGCKLVYDIINHNGLCDYYKIASHPGLSQIKGQQQGKWAYLDSEAIAGQLYEFTDGDLSIVTLYLPGVHCSSCLWLLEHLPKVHAGIQSSRLHFDKKQLNIRFFRSRISLRQVVELLSTIGYEPLISLEDSGKSAKQQGISRKRLYRLGIAGFCFGNIMMLSFPEYFGGAALGRHFENFFRYAALLLSVPVVFYCASEFFVTAWRGLRTRTLNIDAPIALAIIITYVRSLTEILSGTGSGYLDSMSGIVFFMLVGRTVQERAWSALSFHRDYKSYFPIAVQVLVDGYPEVRSLHDLKQGDIVSILHGEIIPADSVLLDGKACIDYSFVTGESMPVDIAEGERLYAGGRQTGGGINIRIEKPVEGSYLTSLWNHQAFAKDKGKSGERDSVIHSLSRYFTIILFSLAAITAVYWAVADTSKIIPAVSAMLIVACPCALLLSSTFTNGAVLRALSDNGLYLRDAQVIETMGKIDTIVFDKTGTLTTGSTLQYADDSPRLDKEEASWVYAVAKQSAHPRSRALAELMEPAVCKVSSWSEAAGQGIRARVEGHDILVGSAGYVGAMEGGSVYVRVDDCIYSFIDVPLLRRGVVAMLRALKAQFVCFLLSGDHPRHLADMSLLFGGRQSLYFEQKPIDKLRFIEGLQKEGHKVLMLGDGLNDAGALQQSDMGITLADDINNFTPSCDAILDAASVDKLPAMMRLGRWGNTGVRLAFAISILYNVAGLYYAVQGRLSPMIAAILMPASTLSIVAIGVGLTNMVAYRLFRKK